AVRGPAPARGSACPSHGAAAAPPRRADRRDEPAGVARVHGVRQRAPHPAWPDRADDRARHARGDGCVRPRDGARLWGGDRRGQPAGGAEGPARDRGLPREGGCPVMSQAPAATATPPVLELEGIHTYYGAIHALKGVTLEVREGEIVTLLGANGA